MPEIIYGPDNSVFVSVGWDFGYYEIYPLPPEVPSDNGSADKFNTPEEPKESKYIIDNDPTTTRS